MNKRSMTLVGTLFAAAGIMVCTTGTAQASDHDINNSAAAGPNSVQVDAAGNITGDIDHFDIKGNVHGKVEVTSAAGNPASLLLNTLSQSQDPVLRGLLGKLEFKNQTTQTAAASPHVTADAELQTVHVARIAPVHMKLGALKSPTSLKPFTTLEQTSDASTTSAAAVNSGHIDPPATVVRGGRGPNPPDDPNKTVMRGSEISGLPATSSVRIFRDGRTSDKTASQTAEAPKAQTSASATVPNNQAANVGPVKKPIEITITDNTTGKTWTTFGEQSSAPQSMGVVAPAIATPPAPQIDIQTFTPERHALLTPSAQPILQTAEIMPPSEYPIDPKEPAHVTANTAAPPFSAPKYDYWADTAHPLAPRGSQADVEGFIDGQKSVAPPPPTETQAPEANRTSVSFADITPQESSSLPNGPESFIDISADTALLNDLDKSFSLTGDPTTDGQATLSNYYASYAQNPGTLAIQKRVADFLFGPSLFKDPTIPNVATEGQLEKAISENFDHAPTQRLADNNPPPKDEDAAPKDDGCSPTVPGAYVAKSMQHPGRAPSGNPFVRRTAADDDCPTNPPPAQKSNDAKQGADKKPPEQTVVKLSTAHRIARDLLVGIGIYFATWSVAITAMAPSLTNPATQAKLASLAARVLAKAKTIGKKAVLKEELQTDKAPDKIPQQPVLCQLVVPTDYTNDQIAALNKKFEGSPVSLIRTERVQHTKDGGKLTITECVVKIFGAESSDPKVHQRNVKDIEGAVMIAALVAKLTKSTHGNIDCIALQHYSSAVNNSEVTNYAQNILWQTIQNFMNDGTLTSPVELNKQSLLQPANSMIETAATVQSEQPEAATTSPTIGSSEVSNPEVATATLGEVTAQTPVSTEAKAVAQPAAQQRVETIPPTSGSWWFEFKAGSVSRTWIARFNIKNKALGFEIKPDYLKPGHYNVIIKRTGDETFDRKYIAGVMEIMASVGVKDIVYHATHHPYEMIDYVGSAKRDLLKRGLFHEDSTINNVRVTPPPSNKAVVPGDKAWETRTLPDAARRQIADKILAIADDVVLVGNKTSAPDAVQAPPQTAPHNLVRFAVNTSSLTSTRIAENNRDLEKHNEGFSGRIFVSKSFNAPCYNIDTIKTTANIESAIMLATELGDGTFECSGLTGKDMPKVIVADDIRLLPGTLYWGKNDDEQISFAIAHNKGAHYETKQARTILEATLNKMGADNKNGAVLHMAPPTRTLRNHFKRAAMEIVNDYMTTGITELTIGRTRVYFDMQTQKVEWQVLGKGGKVARTSRKPDWASDFNGIDVMAIIPAYMGGGQQRIHAAAGPA